MDKIISSLTKLFSNPKVQKMLVIILVIIAILFLLSKISSKFRMALGSIKGVKGKDVYAPIDDARKMVIQDMATGLDNYINPSGWFGEISDAVDGETALVLAVGLPDNEFTYFAQYYEQTFGESLYKAIEGEYSWATGSQYKKVQARLQAMNLVGFSFT